MNKNTSIVVLFVLVIIAIGGYVFPINAVDREARKVLGGSAGPEHTEHQVFLSNFTKGGQSVATTSTASSYTLTSAELRKNVGYISWNAGLDVTLTTMASTSAPFVGLKTGESIEVLFYSATTTGATTITFTAGTGVDLQEDEGGTVIVNGLELSKLTFVKKSDSDILLLVEPYQVGD